jgi:Na+(H+)/acetate symporter ActP
VNEEAIRTNGVVFFQSLPVVPDGLAANNEGRFRLGSKPIWEAQATNSCVVIREYNTVRILPLAKLDAYRMAGLLAPTPRSPLPDRAAADSTWLNPFGPLTTKAAKAAKPTLVYTGLLATMRFRADNWDSAVTNEWVRVRDWLSEKYQNTRGTGLFQTNYQALGLLLMLARLRVTEESMNLNPQFTLQFPPGFTNLQLACSGTASTSPDESLRVMHETFSKNGITLVREGNIFKAFPTKDAIIVPVNTKPYALLYTYSLIIALVCGTAGLPHILVRFYTNPDGVAAKRTTMWVMILIGVFYLFPPVFGVMGRNLMPELYNGLAGVKGTDGVVLKLPRILNPVGRDSVEPTSERSEASAASVSQPATNNDARSARADVVGKQGSTESRPTTPSTLHSQPSTKGFPWGSVLSGITCAGAFAAFMSTFSGLLVSLTGALAHDVYGRIFRPRSTPDQRMRMFKVCAVLCGGGAILLGFFVEKFEINKMVGWAFAIAATSYFPLLFLSTWWRGITMRGAAIGMLAGGTLSLIVIASTMFADQAAWAKGLADFYAGHPLLRILAEQPAIWALPLAIILMIIVSRLTREEVPADIRMKMLVLHAPEKLGLKQEYIQEHQAH